jgi:steroid delta-isomerase-like uncharacterized protein
MRQILVLAHLLLVGAIAHAQATTPLPTANGTIAAMWYEAFNRKDASLVDRIVSETWVDIPSPPDSPPGPVALKRTLVALTTAFPDLRLTIEDVIQEGDKVVVRSEITGTQKEPFFGIPSKGRRLTIQAVDIHQIKDGKIIRTWHTEDWMTGLRQLGVIGP